MSHRPAIVTPSSLSWLHNEVDDETSLKALLEQIEQADFDSKLKLTSIDGISLEFGLPSADLVEEVRAPEAVPSPAPAPTPEAETIIAMPKRPYQPNRLKRKRTHGFLRRMRTAAGRKTLERRRKHGRWKIAVT